MKRFNDFAQRIFSKNFSAQIRTASNLIANVYALIIGIIFVPIYINYIGVEAYGIIGAFNGITAFFWLFDFGIATNINRELSQFYQQEDKRELLDLKKSLEIVCFSLSGIIFILLLGFVSILAYYWFNTEKFSASYLFSVLSILAFSLALQFPIAFYTNGLLGLNKQVPINFISIFANTIKFTGAIIAIIYFEDKFRAFLIAQLIVSLIQMILLKIILSTVLKIADYKGRFRFDVLKKLKKFTSELFANNLVMILLSHSDKFILSRILTLEEFGYYMLAYSITTMTLGLFSNSTINVIFPNFSRLAAGNNLKDLIRNFHLSSQLITWGMVSIVIVMAFFSQEILLIWTRNQFVAEKTSILLSILAVSMGLNTLTLILYYLQLAFGRSNISFRFNLVALLLNVPALTISSMFYGALGAAICWLILNLVYLFTFVPAIQKNFLHFSLKDWYMKDVGKPLLVGIVIGCVFHKIIPTDLTQIYLFLLIGVCFFSIAGLSFIVTDLPKYAFENELFYKLKRKFL